ncbi:5-hydroxytryptamine receptor 3A-like [Channa argus]|uniref:5-hydroxytryptamine receptor 3A-like n=1 Tax=Channa argus TaxID=215402 RepID=UPI00351F9F85
MMLVGFFCLLALTAADASDSTCSYQDVLNYLNLTKDNGLFSMTRPVKDHTHTTVVTLEVVLYAILDVREIDQIFIPYVWIFLVWKNEYIYWNPDDFCGIKSVSIPIEVLWRPDLTIEEMIEKDKAPPSPLLIINSTGHVLVQNDQVLVSTCRMHVYKFPFDIQSCTLSFKSVVHSVGEIHLVHKASSAEVTRWSREVMRTQYEWLFINMTVTSKTVIVFNMEQDVILYTINMKRRPVLYIVNFILPVLFFLCLDLSSFLISDSGGEKLSFKITVLLAVTVMQLILNEILPSSSNQIPLIAVYCIGIFALMMVSLLETIVVKYLIDKDFAPEDTEGDRDQSLSVCGKKQGKPSLQQSGSHAGAAFVFYYAITLFCVQLVRPEEKRLTRWMCDVTSDEKAAEISKGSSSELTEDSHDLKKLSGEMREALKALNLFLGSRKDEGKAGYWTRVTKKINNVFYIFYITACSVFLFCMFYTWKKAEET